MERENLVQKIWHFVVGYHYYAVVSNSVGTFEAAIHSAILPTRAAAKRHLEGVSAYKELEIVSFWSRNRYVNYTDESGRNVNKVV